MAIYQKVVALNKNLHHQHRILPLTEFHFAADMQTLPVTASEFKEAAKEYPIVFVKAQEDSEKLLPMLLLGLKNGQNLFVKDDGRWTARYVPAFIRRYPFIFAETGVDQLTLCLDEAYSGFGTEQGTALFNAEGDTDFLKGVVEFVSAFHRDSRVTEIFLEKLKSLDLLEEKNLKAELRDGREFVVNGFQVVSEEKLLKLEATQVQALFTSGELGLVYAHLMSLSNLNRLVDMAVERGKETTH